jgi:hypothetical protein
LKISIRIKYETHWSSARESGAGVLGRLPNDTIKGKRLWPGKWEEPGFPFLLQAGEERRNVSFALK